MEKNLKMFSLMSFVLAIPLFIIVDWYWKGYGLLIMFIFICFGLICDQLKKIAFPTEKVSNILRYRKNKLFKLMGLIMFVLTPVVIIYGQRIVEIKGVYLGCGFIIIGLIFDCIARIKYAEIK